MTQSADSSQVLGAPAHELGRSTAARRVGDMAAESGLLMAHYEYRVPMSLPAWWCPEGRPDLGEPTSWVQGVLPEAKYQGFRHDRLIGSFHPGHRAKWTAHELCHGLVGFAWRPGASRLFHALAARLAEVLPVALWYFFDEADLRRCPQHAGQGALHGSFCRACEAAAEQGLADTGEAERWWSSGRLWAEYELAAIAESKRLGRPVPFRFESIELWSDGLAYASAQAPRLTDPAFERYVSLFFEEGQGHFRTLADLEDRVLEVMDAICGEGVATPLSGDRWRWITQDLGMRLLTVQVQTEGEVSVELDRLIERLAQQPAASTIQDVMRDYRSLHEDWILPEPEDVFAVGYPLPGHAGRSIRQAGQGLQSATPRAIEAFGDRTEAIVEAFVASEVPERWERRAIGRRFASFLQDGDAPAPADLARFEAAITHAPAADLIATSLGSEAGIGTSVRTIEGAEIVVVDHDVVEEGLAPLDDAASWFVWRGADGDVRVLPVSSEAASGLRACAEAPARLEELGLEPEEAAQLLAHGVLVPKSWDLDVLPDEDL